ncbi:hypothetical protein NE865_12871 [Phthorimaea operculella]|nr:hypothetical protein NE865_12871 [Phthorimaea operculella]
MTPKTPNNSKCSKCNKDASASTKKGIISVNCDCCKKLLCGDCHGLSPTEIRVFELKTVPRIISFLCLDCKNAMTQLPMIMKKLNELTEEVKQLRVRQSMLATESATQEMMERKNRSTNIIIYDLSESASNEADVRKEDDRKACEELITKISNKVNCTGIKTFRLGAPKPGTKRPLKVVLKSKSDALEVLKNRKKLSKPSSVTSDQTPMQREYINHLREELQKRTNNGETGLTIRYIRGHPSIVNAQTAAQSPKN